MNRITIPLLILMMTLPQFLWAHCQVPCGIYDDHARVKAMGEDASTIFKALVQMSDLSAKKDVQSSNQLVRWVNNKESHAEKIIQTISNYFLTQRVKPSQKDYEQRLKDHHAVMLTAMKAKQGSDPKLVDALSEAISKLEAYYPGHQHP